MLNKITAQALVIPKPIALIATIALRRLGQRLFDITFQADVGPNLQPRRQMQSLADKGILRNRHGYIQAPFI